MLCTMYMLSSSASVLRAEGEVLRDDVHVWIPSL